MTNDAGIIDVHTHLFPSSMVEILQKRTEPPRILENANGLKLLEFTPGVRVPVFPETLSLDVKLTNMKKGGIGYAVLSVATARLDLFSAADAMAISQNVNDELIEMIKTHPDQIGAMALIPMQNPDFAAGELERVSGLGLKGAILESNVAGRPLDDPEFRPVFESAAGVDAPLFIHPNHPVNSKQVDVYGMLPVVGFLFDTTLAALRLIFSGVFERHPSLKLFLGHTGSLIPYLAGRLDEFFDMDRLPSGTSDGAHPPSYYVGRLYTDTVCASPLALRLAAELFQPDRIMWGTDAPYFSIDTAWKTLAGADLPPELVTAIERTNARSLFRL
ncbi:MAG: amidohydrolase family protein [Actinobacteria bacterium]|nr:amidohydrolase family protein [Actinomycetota bacterium]